MKTTRLPKMALRLVPVVMLALSGVLVSAVSAGATPLPPSNWPAGQTYNCTGGNVPPGTYNSMVITGVCYMPAGTITVRGNLTVAPGALLDAAATLGDPTDNPNPILPATVLVGGNVNVGRGAVLAIGCSPSGGCHGVTYDRIGGNLTAIGAQGVLVQAVSIGGSASVLGGGGGVLGGPPESNGCFSAPIPAPWSEDAALSQGPNGSPQYTDFEDSSIGGNLSVVGLQTCWLGSLRDQVAGSVTFIGNTTSDPDGMELHNLVGGNLTCLGNLPAPQFGDSGAAPNMVGGSGIGQCGFNVVVPNPAPQAMEGTGVPEHISVPTWLMKTYYGTHTQTQSNSLTSMLGPNVTESGDTLAAELNSDILAGTGLTGSISAVFPPTTAAPLGSTGELVVATVHPDGSESFLANDNCNPCSFDGQTGTVSIRAYGTTSANGTTKGTFLVTSGGAGNGGLSTLAGYGTFSSWGEPAGTLRLVEHLAITGAGAPNQGRNGNPWFRAVLNR
ncbi:MAG: hypothetical protein ACLPR9_02905 [Acidimicrobiales bacterium]|jgi:hypothetical protein